MSAEKVAALEALLSRVQERREEPGARLRLAFDAAAPAGDSSAGAWPDDAGPAVTEAHAGTASSAVAPAHSPSTRRFGGAVDQSPPQPTTPDEPPPSTEDDLPVARESAPEIVLDDAPAVEISEAELAELTEAEAAELEDLDVNAADVEIVEDMPEAPVEEEAEPTTPRQQVLAGERAIEPPTMPRPDLRAEESPSSEVATQPRPEMSRPTEAEEPVTEARPPLADDATSPSAVEATPIARADVTPPPLPDAAPRRDDRAAAPPAGEAKPSPTLASGEVLVQPPAPPEPAPTLQVGDMVIKPRRVEPQILQKDNVGEFIAEVAKVSSATFGEVLEASLELGAD